MLSIDDVKNWWEDETELEGIDLELLVNEINRNRYIKLDFEAIITVYGQKDIIFVHETVLKQVVEENTYIGDMDEFTVGEALDITHVAANAIIEYGVEGRSDAPIFTKDNWEKITQQYVKKGLIYRLGLYNYFQGKDIKWGNYHVFLQG